MLLGQRYSQTYVLMTGNETAHADRAYLTEDQVSFQKV